MISRIYTNVMVKFWSWKSQNKIYHTVKFMCDDCGKKGLVLRQISVLNLAFWLLLGVLTMYILKWTTGSWWLGGTIGFLVWYISTAINVFKVKPQCRHCRSCNVRIPEKETIENKEEIIAEV